MRTLKLIAIVLLALATVACEAVPTEAPAATDGAAPSAANAPGAADAAGETAANAASNGANTAPDAQPASDTAAGAEAADAPAGAALDSGAAGAGDVVATVNGEPIPLGEFQRQAFDTQRYFVEQGLDPNSDEGQRELLYLRRQVLDDMINQRLIEQAAAEMDVTATDAEVEQGMQAYVDELGGEEAFLTSLAEAGTSRQEVAEMERASLIGQKMLDQIAADVPTEAEHVHARHILCQSADACAAALTRLEAGEAFEDVAKDVSQDASSAERGGDLDWIARGMLPSSQLEEAIFALEPGERSGVVETDFGYHVIEVIERDANRPLSEDQRYKLREKALMDWLAEQRAAADIVIHVPDLAQPPVE